MNKILDSAISTCDELYVPNRDLERIINDLENISSRIKAVADRANNNDSATLERNSQDVKEISNNLKLFLNKRK